MQLAPEDYDFGDEENYSFAMTVTCSNDEARKMFVLAHGHMLNYNHEEAIACFTKCVELDPNCAMRGGVLLTVSRQITIGHRA